MVIFFDFEWLHLSQLLQKWAATEGSDPSLPGACSTEVLDAIRSEAAAIAVPHIENG